MRSLSSALYLMRYSSAKVARTGNPIATRSYIKHNANNLVNLQFICEYENVKLLKYYIDEWEKVFHFEKRPMFEQLLVRRF